MEFLIGVGSNRGDRGATITRALELLCKQDHYHLLAQAALFENPAQGGPAGQHDYLNTVWRISSGRGPHQCLHQLQAIECVLGRIRTVINGARTIDLDLLMCDCMPVIETAVLSLPHPRMLDRDFVMQPINAIAPEWIHPIVGSSMAEIYEQRYV